MLIFFSNVTIAARNSGARNHKAEPKKAEEMYDNTYFHCRTGTGTLEEPVLLPGPLDGLGDFTPPKANIVSNKKQQGRRCT